MGKLTDFFFGKYYNQDGQALMSLNDIVELAEKVSPDFFTRQFNRFLADHNGRLMLSDSTSCPSFWQFIDNLAPESVGYIEIYARTDINDSVDATLACDICLEQGIISVTPNWCAYKDIRADEIISTLLVPLHLKGLRDRSFIRWDDGKTEPLIRNEDWGSELQKIFILSKYPHAIGYREEGSRRMMAGIRELISASEVATRNLKGDAAWEALRELREAASTTE